MDAEVESRLQTLERDIGYEKKLRALSEELTTVRKRGFLQQTGAVLLVGLLTAAFGFWADRELNKTNESLQGFKQKHELELQKMRAEHEAALAIQRDVIENRRTDVEIFKQLTPALMSSKKEETSRAIAIVGALNTEFWRPIADAFKNDVTQAKQVQQIGQDRLGRYQGWAVSCDRASHRTTQRLTQELGVQALTYCQTIKKVDHKGPTEPYRWPEGTGVSFNTGHVIGNQSVWCSCFFRT
jgi:hypothetical protein